MSPRPERPLQHVLTVEVFADDEGTLTVVPTTDLDEADAARVLAMVADQLNPALDRADEVQAWGAGRRRRG